MFTVVHNLPQNLYGILKHVKFFEFPNINCMCQNLLLLLMLPDNGPVKVVFFVSDRASFDQI